MFQISTSLLVELNNIAPNHLKKSPLFIFPGLEGHCNIFKDVAGILSEKNIQLYGLEFTKEVPYYSDITCIAKFYLRHIIQKMNKIGLNSFHLAGYSFGKF